MMHRRGALSSCTSRCGHACGCTCSAVPCSSRCAACMAVSAGQPCDRPYSAAVLPGHPSRAANTKRFSFSIWPHPGGRHPRPIGCRRATVVEGRVTGRRGTRSYGSLCLQQPQSYAARANTPFFVASSRSIFLRPATVEWGRCTSSFSQSL